MRLCVLFALTGCTGDDPTYQPNEHVLQLAASHVAELDARSPRSVRRRRPSRSRTTSS
jgi:hypothetical protein